MSVQKRFPDGRRITSARGPPERVLVALAAALAPAPRRRPAAPPPAGALLVAPPRPWAPPL